MKNDQIVRITSGILGTVAYLGRLAFVGNGTIDVFGYHSNPFAFLVIALVVLALPETIDMLPFGPSKKG